MKEQLDAGPESCGVDNNPGETSEICFSRAGDGEHFEALGDVGMRTNDVF